MKIFFIFQVIFQVETILLKKILKVTAQTKKNLWSIHVFTKQFYPPNLPVRFTGILCAQQFFTNQIYQYFPWLTIQNFPVLEFLLTLKSTGKFYQSKFLTVKSTGKS